MQAELAQTPCCEQKLGHARDLVLQNAWLFAGHVNPETLTYFVFLNYTLDPY